jgi:hypothetical protein
MVSITIGGMELVKKGGIYEYDEATSPDALLCVVAARSMSMPRVRR